MKILIYGLNYSPELTGVGKYTGEMADWLSAKSHDVRVVTAPPYYPEWRVDRHYSSRLYRVEPGDGKATPRVYRCPIWVPAKPRGLSRVLHLSSFALSSFPVMVGQIFWKPDVVFTVEPTFFAAPMAIFSAALSGAASWLHVQDFEVDAAFDLGLLPPGGAMHAVAMMFERFFTGCFSGVSSISSKMVDRIASKGHLKKSAVLFPNWGDVDSARFTAQGTPNRYRDELGLEGKTVLLYSGNMGEKQGLEILTPLVEAFKDDARVHFLFCGDGVYRQHLEKEVRHCHNVSMLPLQPRDRLNELLDAADIHLLPQKRGAADLVMPSKLIGILASGRPVIATADEGTQVAQVVAGCGLTVPTGDAEALYSAAVTLVEDGDLRSRLGSAARDYAVKHFSKDRVLRRFEREMLDVLTPPSKGIRLARSVRN